MPIEFSNEEFFYYIYLNLIKYHIKSLNTDIKDKVEQNNKIEKDENKKKENENRIFEDELEILKHKIQKTLNFIKKNTFDKNKKRIEYLIILIAQASDI